MPFSFPLSSDASEENQFVKVRIKLMPRNKNDPPAVRVYTVCDESRYLIVRNVPSFGCGDDLLKLFSSYGDVEECKPMDAEDCEPYTDVYWIKFHLISNARFAKRKLDESVFLGNQLQVSYAPEFENLHDTKEKLDARRKEVLARLDPRPGRSKGTDSTDRNESASPIVSPQRRDLGHGHKNYSQRDYTDTAHGFGTNYHPISRISSDKDYFTSQSMNQTVHLVREKLIKIQSTNEHSQAEPVAKKLRTDNRRRI